MGRGKWLRQKMQSVEVIIIISFPGRRIKKE
jgi:hypothetical protein